MAYREVGGGGRALEPVESNCPAPFGPSTVTPEPLEIGRPAPTEPSAVPPESAGGGCFDLSEPSEPREGLERQHANEE